MKTHNACVEEVAPKVSTFLDKAFDDIVISSPSNPVPTKSNTRLSIPCTHRSQTDYFILGASLFHMGIKNIRIAAGDNLTNFPVIGPAFRTWGAFTVERDSASRRTYIQQLCGRVTDIMRRRGSVIVFPEMGRSYSGAMMEVKQVILGAAILLQARYPEFDVRFLPCAISYEMLPELLQFPMLLQGKRLRKPPSKGLTKLQGNMLYFGADLYAFSKFILASNLGKKHGRVYIDIDKSHAVGDIVDFEASANHQARDEFFKYRDAMKQVSTFMYTRFTQLYRLLPLHLMASLLSEKKTLSPQQARELLPPLLDKLRAAKRNTSSLEPLSIADLVETGMSQLRYGNAARVRKNTIAVEKPFLINYYAASLKP